MNLFRMTMLVCVCFLEVLCSCLTGSARVCVSVLESDDFEYDFEKVLFFDEYRNGREQFHSVF